MKYILTTLLLTFLGFSLFAQAVPQGMNYQAVARDLQGQVLADQEIGLRIELILDGKAKKIAYTETHQVTTNRLGMFSITIGEGFTLTGNFTEVPWSQHEIWMQVGLDETGSGEYATISSSRLLAVPYAFHAGSADKLSGGKESENRNGAIYWHVLGNSGLSDVYAFLGTKDFQDLVMKTNNTEAMRITALGEIEMQGDLDVGGNVDIASELTVGGIARFNNTTQSTTKDNGAVIVEGGVGIEKNVNIGGNNEVDGTLGVDGITSLKNTTQSTTKDNGSLVVEGGVGVENNVNIGGNLAVTGNSTVSGNAVVTGNHTVNGNTGLNGQVTIDANLAGGDASYGAYPLRVQGSDQGIAIKLNAGTPLAVNNFVTFFNGSGAAVGGIEGQDYNEKQAFPPFAYERAINIATEIKAGVAIGLSFIPTCVGGLVVSCGVSASTVAIAAADLVLATANLTAYEVFLSSYIGVTYSSGSADYAEWLERAYPEEQISAGDIIAVNGGKITKYTENAQQYMAVSTNPAILGNVPTDGDVSNMEKVAFMGQIPVKVRGLVITGDYILPSGLNDGTGIGISPDKITAEQYRKIVGVAWSNSLMEGGIGLVNMAIGLNSNDVATLVAKQEKKLATMENRYKSLEARINALEQGTPYNPSEAVADNPTATSEADAERVLTQEEILATQFPSEFTDEIMQEAISYLESEYNRRGIDISNHPGLHKLLTDMDFQAEVIQKTKETYKATYQSIQARIQD